MAAALRKGYGDLYERNEKVHELTKEKLKNLVVEMTGLESDDSTVLGIVGTFTQLKDFADFGSSLPQGKAEKEIVIPPAAPRAETASTNDRLPSGLGLSYTINLNLPETTDVEVFNAIFRSLRENLL